MKDQIRKWTIVVLIILLLAVPLTTSTACEPGQLLHVLVTSSICGVKVFSDGSLQGVTEYAKEWLRCVVNFTLPEGEHMLDFMLPSSTLAQVAGAKGETMAASETENIKVSLKGMIANGVSYEVSGSYSKKSSGGSSALTMSEVSKPTIVVKASKTPFTPKEMPPPGAFATSIENFSPGDPIIEEAPIENILGPPDEGDPQDVLGSIGHFGAVTVSFGSKDIMDGPGDDIKFWFGGFDNDIETMEGFRVEGSRNGENFEQIAEIPRGKTLSPPVPLTPVGVDLAGTEVAGVKFLKIIGTGTDHTGKGLELNAIEAIHTVPTPPCAFIGNAYLDGEPVSEGKVSAWVQGEKVAETTTDADGNYYLQVQGKEGQEVSFKVAGYAAEEITTWKSGMTIKLDLHVTSPPPPAPRKLVYVLFDIQLLGTNESNYNRFPVGGKVWYVDPYGQHSVVTFGEIPYGFTGNPPEGCIVSPLTNHRLSVGSKINHIKVAIGGWGEKELDVTKVFEDGWEIPEPKPGSGSVHFPGKFVFERTGDINMDGTVDVYDLTIVGSHFNQKSKGQYVLAQPMPPCTFYGTVYTDSHMVKGARVTAWIGGSKVGETVTEDDGSYYLQITGDYVSSEVNFKVEGVDVEETGSWTMGEMKSLDLHTVSPLPEEFWKPAVPPEEEEA